MLNAKSKRTPASAPMRLAARLAGDGLVIAQCPYMGDADVQLVVDAVRGQ